MVELRGGSDGQGEEEGEAEAVGGAGMKAPQIVVQGRVTAASATVVTVTPGVSTWDVNAGGKLNTIDLKGTGLVGYAVGDPITVTVSG